MKIPARPTILSALCAAICTGAYLQGASLAANIVPPPPKVVGPSCIPTEERDELPVHGCPVPVTSQADTVYTKLTNDVVMRIPVGPAVVRPIDTMKLQIANRINSGLISGQLTDTEYDEVRASLNELALYENNLKLTYGGVNCDMVANLMPKYHMLNQRLQDLMSNTNTKDYMPNFENRAAGLERLIMYHEAMSHLTPAETEQLLAGLNVAYDEYATYRATGGTVTGDELASLHKDLSKVRCKLNERLTSAVIDEPELAFQREELLVTIKRGLACNLLSSKEAACLMDEYNKAALLEQRISAERGCADPELARVARKINDLNFVVRRQLNDRQLAAGQSFHF